MRSKIIVYAAACMALLVPRLAAAGPLDDVRSEVHGGESSSSSSSDSDDDSDDSDYGFDYGGGICTSCSGPGLLAGSSAAYLPHPYAGRVDGYIARETAAGLERPAALRLSTESAYQYSGLWRLGLGARGSIHWLEADSDWSYYRDSRAHDSLWIGDANLGFAPVRRPHGIWHLGAGGRFLLDSKPAVPDESGNAIGWNVTTGIDLFPFDPIVLGAEADFGQLGQAWLWRVRGSIGIQLSHAEVFAGYDHMQIGAASLGGPMLGLRLWL